MANQSSNRTQRGSQPKHTGCVAASRRPPTQRYLTPSTRARKRRCCPRCVSALRHAGLCGGVDDITTQALKRCGAPKGHFAPSDTLFSSRMTYDGPAPTKPVRHTMGQSVEAVQVMGIDKLPFSWVVYCITLVAICKSSFALTSVMQVCVCVGNPPETPKKKILSMSRKRP